MNRLTCGAFIIPIAVSYTHLDVYKRQVEGTLKEFQDQLKISGIDKVKQELVKQLNAYNEGR